jgi:hypothetical protein
MADGSRGWGLLLTTDNGTQFTSAASWRCLTPEHCPLPDGQQSPKGDGLIERFRRSLK